MMPTIPPLFVVLALAGLLPLSASAQPAQPAPTQPGVSPTQPSASPAPPPTRDASAKKRTISPEIQAKVARNPLLQRLSTVGGVPRFGGGAKGAARYKAAVIGGDAVAVTLPTPRGLLQAEATPDGKRLWISGAMLRDSGAILRLGDLLPLLQAIGVNDRELALGVRVFQVGSGVPPSYALTFRPGLLWKHRAALEAQARARRVLYSLTTGRLTVLGAHVMVEGPSGALRVKLMSPAGDQVARIEQMMTPKGCRDLEQSLRSKRPVKLLAVARKKLAIPSMTQACAARFIALVGGAKAPAILRAALMRERLARPFDLVEALATVSPSPEKANLDAVLKMIRRSGTVGADAACRAAPLTWTNAMLERADLRDATRSVFTRCAWH